LANFIERDLDGNRARLNRRLKENGLFPGDVDPTLRRESLDEVKEEDLSDWNGSL